MSFGDLEKIQAENEVDENSLRADFMLKALNMGGDRLMRLRKAGFYFETVFVNAQLLEQFMKLVIAGYESRRRILRLRGAKDIYEDVRFNLKDDEPLGHLIGIFRAIKADRELLRRLDRFNELRKEAVHHILDGTKEIEAFDLEVKSYFESGEYRKMLQQIQVEQKKVRAEIVLLSK